MDIPSLGARKLERGVSDSNVSVSKAQTAGGRQPADGGRSAAGLMRENGLTHVVGETVKNMVIGDSLSFIRKII